MPKRADIDEGCNGGGHGTRGCRRCSEYDTCDECDRRVCKYVSVEIDGDTLVCRPCARDKGFASHEIARGAVFYDKDKEREWKQETEGKERNDM